MQFPFWPNSASPSSSVKRPPSTAFGKMGVIVELKIHSPACQSQLARQHIIVVQTRLLARAQVKMDDVAKVSTAKSRVQPQKRRFPLSDFTNPGTSPSLRFKQGIFNGR